MAWCCLGVDAHGMPVLVTSTIEGAMAMVDVEGASSERRCPFIAIGLEFSVMVGPHYGLSLLVQSVEVKAKTWTTMSTDATPSLEASSLHPSTSLYSMLGVKTQSSSGSQQRCH